MILYVSYCAPQLYIVSIFSSNTVIISRIAEFYSKIFPLISYLLYRMHNSFKTNALFQLIKIKRPEKCISHFENYYFSDDLTICHKQLEH